MRKVEQPVELGLRLRERETAGEAPDLAAFTRAPQLPAPGTEAQQACAGSPLDAADGERTLPVFLRDEAAPIPTPDHPLTLPVRAWDLPCESRGRLALVPLSPRSVTVMATCVTLVLPSGVALAQTPAAAPASTEAPVVAAPEAHASPATPEGTAPQGIAPAVASGNLFGALIGEDLAMSMRDGSTFRGRLLAVQTPWLVCARLEDGRVVAVLETEVAQVHAIDSPPPRKASKLPSDTGAGRIGAGVTLITGGAVMAIGGIFGAVYYDGYSYSYYGYGGGNDTGNAEIWLPLVIPAAVMIGVGIPLLIRGRKIQREYRAKYPAPDRRSASRPAKVAWDGGLRLRF